MEAINTECTKELARFVVETSYDRLPKEAVEQSKRCFIDWLGVTLAGSKETLASILLGVVEEMGGEKQATVFGRGVRTSLLSASLVNASMSHAIDYDDVFWPAKLHPSAPVLPSIVSVAEWKHLSGQDVITAFVLGYEVEARIGELAGTSLLDKGWHPTSVLGTFGAAAGAGKLLGLTVEQMVHALGIAGVQVAGLVEVFGSMSKPLQVGRSAANGALSALLAQRGFTSTERILEAKQGFFGVYMGGGDLGKITAGLGGSYQIMRNTFKLHACCAGTHASIDAALEIRRRYDVRPEDIVEIQCQVCPGATCCELQGKPKPRTGLEGKFSIQHCVAVALAEGAAGEDKFTDAKVRDPKLVNLGRKVKVFPDPDLPGTEAIVTIVTKDGREYRQKTTHSKGTPENPPTDEELRGKFQTVASVALPPSNVEKVMGLAKALEKLNDINTLITLCR